MGFFLRVSGNVCFVLVMGSVSIHLSAPWKEDIRTSSTIHCTLDFICHRTYTRVSKRAESMEWRLRWINVQVELNRTSEASQVFFYFFFKQLSLILLPENLHFFFSLASIFFLVLVGSRRAFPVRHHLLTSGPESGGRSFPYTHPSTPPLPLITSTFLNVQMVILDAKREKERENFQLHFPCLGSLFLSLPSTTVFCFVSFFLLYFCSSSFSSASSSFLLLLYLRRSSFSRPLA